MSDSTYDVSLPPPRQTLSKIEEMRARESQPDIQELIDVLELDPVTTLHLLRQVNSPIYQLRQHVATLDRAATMLGFDAVSNTVFIESHIPKPEALDEPRALAAYAYVVRTSVTASLVADILAHQLKMEQHGAVRTAAMLLQLGRLALLSMRTDEYVPMWTEATSPTGESVAVPPGIGREIVRLGTDYTRLGEQIAREWNLPRSLSESIRHHTSPDRAGDAERHLVLAAGVSQYAARTIFEPENELDRDQGKERIAQAVGELAAAFDASRSRIDEILDEAKQAAYRQAAAVEL